ncbi:hypothetical protein ACFV8T_37455 [Streptomyces sp. NPDC059832]|uniref:hypothetical protein n=1 Tax=unclassified Streptomyces TaxID=2593676 RepID=UPI003658ACB6
MSEESISSARYSGEARDHSGLYYYGYRNAAAQIEPTGSGDQAPETATEGADVALIPAAEVNPEHVGALSLRYVDGQPQLVVSGGTVIPAGLTVVDGSGDPVAPYIAGKVVSSTTFSMTDSLNKLPVSVSGMLFWADERSISERQVTQTKEPTPVQLTPETTEPALIPADQVNPEDIGTLSIEYRDGQPLIVVSGGTVLPAGLTVVDGSGDAVAVYAAGSATEAGARGLLGNSFKFPDAVPSEADDLYGS